MPKSVRTLPRLTKNFRARLAVVTVKSAYNKAFVTLYLCFKYLLFVAGCACSLAMGPLSVLSCLPCYGRPM